MMNPYASHYLNLVPYTTALREQTEAVRLVRAGEKAAILLGFESESVITLGRRANAQVDLIGTLRQGVQVVEVDRGGQATLHNPGQLVIFPIAQIRAIGARRWVEGLSEVTRLCLQEYKIESHWHSDRPGLYTAHGKIMACGVRLNGGISTHGVAINVCNDLTDFAMIRACGHNNQTMDRMGSNLDLAEIFTRWCQGFKTHFASIS